MIRHEYSFSTQKAYSNSQSRLQSFHQPFHAPQVTKVSRTNLPNKGVPPKVVGGGRTGLGKLYEEGTMQEEIVMHCQEEKRPIFFLFPTLHRISCILASFGFLFVFFLCKRRTFR